MFLQLIQLCFRVLEMFFYDRCIRVMCSELYQNSGYNAVIKMDLHHVEDPLYMMADEEAMMRSILYCPVRH